VVVVVVVRRIAMGKKGSTGEDGDKKGAAEAARGVYKLNLG
jgi:hypothetical protein